MASSNNGLPAYQDSSGFQKFEASRTEKFDRKRQYLTGSSVERVGNPCSTQNQRTQEVTKRSPSSLNKDLQWKKRQSNRKHHECTQNTEKRRRKSFRKMPDENNDVDVYALNTNDTHGFGQRDLNSQMRSASYKPTKFYSSMDYDMSVPSKYLNGKQVPSNGEIDIEVCVKPTTKYVDHTTHTQCRFKKRPYRSELVVQLGTKKGTVYQSINNSNSDVTEDCDSDITEQKTLGITCLRVEHDIHIPVDVVIVNDSDQNIENIKPVADSDSCYVKPTTCLPRTNGCIKNVIPVHTSPGSDNVPARTKSLATTGQPELSQKITTTSMSNTIIDRRGIGLISNDTVVNFDRTSRDNQDSIHYINASLKHNNQYLLHCAKDSRPSDTSFSENNPLACSDLSDLDADEYSYKNSLEEIHSVLKEATLMENIQFKTEVINNGIDNCSKTDMQPSLTNCSGVVACDTIPEDDQCSTDNNRSKTDDNQWLIDYFRVSCEENRSTIGNALLLENNRSKTKDDEPCLTGYSQIEFDDNPTINERSATINDNRCLTNNEYSLTDYSRVPKPSDNRSLTDEECYPTKSDRSLTDKPDLTDHSQVTTPGDNLSFTDGKCYPTKSDRSLSDKPSLTDHSLVTTLDDNLSFTNEECYPIKCDRSLTDKPGLTDHSRVTTLDANLSLTNEECYLIKCDRSLTDKPGLTDYSRVANDNEICLTGKNNDNIFSEHSETSSDDNQSLINYELSRDATSVREYEKVRDREETQQSSVALCAYESDQDEDWTCVHNLSENGSDVTSSTNELPGADCHVTDFVNSDIKCSNNSIELCTDDNYVMSKPDKGDKSAENIQMFAACWHTKNEMPNSLRHSTRQTDKNKVLLTKEVALGNCCTPGSENKDELLHQLNSFSNNNLPRELDISETDNICTRGCPMTAFSVKSTENDSTTDTEFESSQEYEDTTEDINDSSESEYETASSNFNKCSDVSEYEYDVDEDLKMPRPVVTIDVEMVTPPEFAFRPQSRVVEQGNTAKFICVLKGCPKPEVTWFKNGIILRSSKKYRSYEGIENMFVLEVTDVDPSDTGEYVCTASNAEGRIYASAELTIEDPPLPIPQQQEPFFMDRLEDITVSVGSDVQFSCQVGGNPAPQILWFHNGVGLKRLQRFTFSRSDTGQCTLSMPDVRHDDEGEVACIASNILGRATCCAYLNVKDSPKSRNGDHIDKNSNSVDQNVIASTHHTQPNVQNIVAIEGTTTKFKCSVIGNPKPSVTWYKDGLAINTSMHADGHYRIVEEGFTHSLEITRTEDSDAGHYYCTVSNSTGAIMCSCFLLVNDRKENSFIVDSVISPMTISTKTESITRTIQREIPVVTTVEPKMTLDNSDKSTENNDLESSNTTHESTVLLLNLQRDDNINNVHSGEVLETTSIEHNGAIPKEINGHAQSEDLSHIKLSDNITLQCISPGMNINIEGNSSKKETCEETIKDNCQSIDTKEVSDEPSTHSFCVEKKFTMNNEPIQRKIDIKFTPIKLARHMELDKKSQRSYDLDNGNATDDSSDSTDQLLHSLQLAQNSVELDSDDDIMNIRSYQYSTTRTYNHPQNSEDDMERASRLSEKVDSCMDIVNTVLNLASLNSEGEKELRMRLEELRSGLSSSGSSVIDDQELSIRTLSVTGSSCNTPLSIEDNTLSVDLKETGHADQPEVSLDDDISDIESLNRSSSSVNLEHVSSPRQDQKIRLKRHDPKFPEMAANLLDISNPYEMIKEAESKNKDSSVEMMADVLSSQIVIEGLYDYSTSKINANNVSTQNSTKEKVATIGNAAKNNTHYLKNVSSFADNVVAEILIDAALRIKDVTKSMNRYKTKEMLDTNVHHGSNLSHKVLNEIIKVASENASQTNNIDLEIFDDVLHEIILEESADFLNPIVSKEVRCCSPVENCLENTSEDTLELRPTSDQKNDVVVEEFHSEIRIPIHQPVLSISSANTLLFSTKDNLQKTAETQQQEITVNSKILDTHQEIIIPIQLPSPTVPTVVVNEEPKEEKEASTTLKKVKARNILSGFLGNAMLLEQQKLKPTVKLSRSQSDRIQRPVQTSHDKLKRNSTDPDVLLKRCLSERRKQAKESNQSNELKQIVSNFIPSSNEPEIVTLLQMDLHNTEQVTDENDIQHEDNYSTIEPRKVVQSLTIDLCNVKQTTDDSTESTSQDDANVLDKKDDLEQIGTNEHINDENELSIEPENVLLSQTIDKNNSHDNESMEKQNVISSEEPITASNEHILEAIKEIKDENVISEKQEDTVKSSLSRSMSARIPIRRKSHSFISKDPRYLSWQAQRVNHKKSAGEPRTVPSRTQSLILPRTQFSDQQIVEEKEIKQSVIDTICNEQKGDGYDQAIVVDKDESDSKKTEEEKDSIEKQFVENPIEPTQENENNLNNHVPTSEQINEYKTTVSDQENRDECMSENKLSVQRPEKMNQRERPISSLISMFETTIQSSPRNSKVHEFGLTFKHDEKEKKSKPVNRSQSMMCRRTETIIPRKPDNRLSMDGSVHLNQLERLNVSIDITKPEETGNEKIEVETQNRSLSLSDVSKKSVNSSVEDVTFETRAERLNLSDHEDDDVFSLPIMEDSSCDEELLDSKSKSTSRSEQSLISTQSSSESASFESAPTFIQPLSPVEVQDGESVRLEVKVVGNPEPEIKWFRDGNELQEDQHYQYVLDEDDTWSLILAEATPADAGEFTCQAENCHGSVSCTAYLNVEEDPATVTEDEISSELGDSRTNKDTETVARLLKEHKEKRLRNGSLSTSGAEEEMFCRYIVLENYQSDKLNIQQGEEVEVLESQSEERWLIKHTEDSSMIGYIPASLLEKLDEDDSGQSKRNSVKLAIQELFPEIVPTAESMQENKLKRKLSAKERLLTMRQYSDQDDVKDSFDMCVAIASYIPVEEDVDHIPLVEGQYVEILDSDGAIEWLVQTKPTKVNPPRRGWVPASHLMKDRATMVPGQTESLNRMISRVILDESDSDLAGTKKQEALIKRRYVLEELLQTERAFVKNMMFCLETYLPLVEDQNAPPAVKGKKDVLFLNFEKICDFHKNTFVKELEECGNDAYSVGRAFIKWQCNFEYHVQYCKNKPRSENCLTPTVKACFDEYLRSKGIVDKFSLSDYLIKPVQRLTKYQLLLKEVVKYTSRAKEDCIELEMALNVMMQVPKRANDLMHISLIEGFQGNINDLGKLYRQEDYTVWTGKQKGRGKERHVFLFKDLIMLTKIKKDPRSEGFTYAYKNHMTIPGIGMTEESRDERCFELWYGKASSSLSMTLQAKTKYVKEAWVKEIRSLLEQKQMEMLEAKASVERIYGALHQTRSSIRSASSISSLNSEPGTLSNSSLLSKSSESLTFNETSTSSLGATSSLSVPARLHGDSFTSLDSDSPPRDNCEDLEIGGLYEISDDFIAGGMCGLELSKGELVKLVEAENNNVCIVQSMPSPGCCTGEEGSVPPYLLRRRKSLEAPVSIVEKPETVSVNVGDNATFTCTFTGMPTPTTDWYFKGHVIKGQSSMNADEGLWISTITILNVNIEDSGKYRCVINNAFSTKSCTAHLHVAYVWGSPSITTIESSDDAILEFDDDTIMSLPDNSPSIATDHLKTNIFEINSTITNIHNNNVNTSETSIEHIVEKDIIIED